jgi:hypothetical protein
VTQGDYFVIDSATVGSDDGTWRFKLVEETAGVLLIDVLLPPVL